MPTLTYQNFINTSQLPVSFAPGLTWGADYNLRTTYSMQYLFNVQRTLGSNSTLEVGYTGNQGRKVAYLVNANAPLPGITTFDAREPYPEWHGIQFLNGDGIGNYNAFSAQAHPALLAQPDHAVQLHLVEGARREQRHPRHRLRLHAREPALPLLRLRSYAGFNVPHRFVTSVLYTLPFGKGQQFLNHGGVVNQVVGGWQVSTITTIQSGTSINPDSWDSAGMGAGFPHSNRLNCVAGANPVADNPNSGPLLRPRGVHQHRRRRVRQLRPQQPDRALHVERRLLHHEGLPDQREARAAVPHGDVQRSQPSGLGPAERRLGHAERDAGRQLRPHPLHEPVAADPVRVEVSLLFSPAVYIR